MVRRRKIVFPFDEVAAELGPPFTGGSVLQHLQKMKNNQVTAPAKRQRPAFSERSNAKPRDDDVDSAEQGEPSERVRHRRMNRGTFAGRPIAGRLI